MEPDWFRIANEYGFTRGPSLPFILGGLWLLKSADQPPPVEADFRALLFRMHDDMPSDYHGSIDWCGNTGAHILEITKAFKSRWVKSDQGGTLDWSTVHLGWLAADDFEGFVNALWSQYRQPIIEATFSIEDKNWRAFDDTEIAKLLKILKP